MDVNDNLLERIASDPRILFGKPAIRGTRIAVEHVLEMMAAGMTQDKIVEGNDRLSPDDIRACLTYAYLYVVGELGYGKVTRNEAERPREKAR